MTSAEETLTLRDQPTPILTDWSDKLCLPSPLHSDSMELSTLILLSSRPTWCPTPGSTSLWLPMLQSSQLRRLTTSSCLLLRSPTPASN